MGRTCFIFGAGEEPESAPEMPEGSLIIAADGGYERLSEWGILPELCVGDFDSLRLSPRAGEVIRLPAEKDVTDMDYSLEAALARGADEIFLYGASGGRLDHTLANIQLLARASKRGVRAYIIGRELRLTAVTNGALRFPPEGQGYISVFAQGGDARGVTLRGLKYTLEDDSLTCDFALGVSNEFIGESALISVDSGTLIVFWQFPFLPYSPA